MLSATLDSMGVGRLVVPRYLLCEKSAVFMTSKSSLVDLLQSTKLNAAQYILWLCDYRQGEQKTDRNLIE